MRLTTQKYLFLLFSIIISSCSSLESDGDKYCKMLNEFSNKLYDELKEGDLSNLMELQKEFIDDTKEITDKYNQEEFSAYLFENCDFKFEEIIQKAMNDAQKNMQNSKGKIHKNYKNNREYVLKKERYTNEFDEHLNSLIKNGNIIIPESCDEIKDNLYGSDAFNCVENDEKIIKERNVLKISIREESLIFLDDRIGDLEYLYYDIVNFIDNGGGRGEEVCDYCLGDRAPDSSDNPEKAIIVLRSFLGRGVEDANTEKRILKDILGAYFMLRDRRYNELYSDDDLSYKEILMKFSFENIPNKYYQRVLRVNSEYPMNFLFKKGAIKPDDFDYSPPLPPPPPPPAPEIIVVVEDEEEVEETIIDIDFDEATQEEIIEEVEVIEEDFDVDVPFAIVEDVPVHPGCENVPKSQRRSCFQEKLQSHIKLNLRYPEIAQEMGIQGRVWVQFIISKDGSITGIRTRGTDKSLEKEAQRIIEMLPTMTPGKQRGRPVRVPFSIPITFSLN